MIQLGQDPLFAQTPQRNFRADLCLQGDLGESVQALCADLACRDPGDRAARRAGIAARNAQSWAARDAQVAKDAGAARLSKGRISAELSDLAATTGTTNVGELGAQLPHMRLGQSTSWYESPHSGGLGFGLPAAMGMALARPDRLTIATPGDGSHIFSNPVACHQVAEALGLTLLVIVLNNAEWGAVRASVQGLYRDGHASRANQVPLTDLSPSPDFQQVARASRHWAATVTTRARDTGRAGCAPAPSRNRA